MNGSLVRVAETLGHAGEHLAREAGYLVDDARELALTEHDELHIGLGHDCRVARRLLEQGEFPERVARTEGRDLATVPGHRGGAADDHEELVAGLALGDEDLAGRDVDVLGPFCHQLEVLAGAGREERDLLEVVDEDITARHGRESNDLPAPAHAAGTGGHAAVEMRPRPGVFGPTGNIEWVTLKLYCYHLLKSSEVRSDRGPRARRISLPT